MTRDHRIIPLAISETTFRIPEFIPGFACKLDGPRSHLDVHFAGKETLDGLTVNHIRVGLLTPQAHSSDDVINAALARLDLYIDVQTYSLVALQRNSFPYDNYDNYLPIEFRYAAYQSVAGVQIPLAVKHIFNGREIESIVITNATREASFPDADFK